MIYFTGVGKYHLPTVGHRAERSAFLCFAFYLCCPNSNHNPVRSPNPNPNPNLNSNPNHNPGGNPNHRVTGHNPNGNLNQT